MMIPDFTVDIRIRLAELKLFLLLPDFANFLPYANSFAETANIILMSIGKSGIIKFEFQAT